MSYLNNDFHKINGEFKPENIKMKLTLQRNLKDKYLWSFSKWNINLNKNIKF